MRIPQIDIGVACSRFCSLIMGLVKVMTHMRIVLVTGVMIAVSAWALFDVSSLIESQRATAATPKFLTLPFPSDPHMKIQQGWLYDFNKVGCDSTAYKHCGIDYVKNVGGAWQSFPVLAAAEGEACGNCSGRVGNAVWVRHTVNGSTYYTYYGHLARIADNIPIGSQSTTVHVKPGDVIGMAGNSGAEDVGVHLHFQFHVGANKYDPYDLWTTADKYPDPAGTNGKRSGTNDYWTSNPPVYLGAPSPQQDGPVKVEGALVEGGKAVVTIKIKNDGNAATPAIFPYVEGNNTAGQFWQSSNPQPASRAIQPSETVTFTVEQDLWSAGTWTSNGIFLWNSSAGQYWKPLPANGQNQQFSFTVQAQTCSPNPNPLIRKVGEIRVSNGQPNAGEMMNAVFTVSNPNPTNCASFSPNSLFVRVIGPGDIVRDFPSVSDITVPPDGNYPYSQFRTFDVPGNYRAFAVWTDSTGTHDVPLEAGTSHDAYFTVHPVCLPDPKMTTDLVISPNPAVVGQTVTAKMTVTNRGCGDFVAAALGVDGFPSVTNLTIPRDGSYQYQQSRTFDTPGVYGGGAAYQLPSGGWYNLRGEGNAVDWVALRVTPCAPDPKVTSSLAISPNPVFVGQTVTARVTISNAASAYANFVAQAIGVGDFPFASWVTIRPGESYDYTASKTYSTPGDYGEGVYYQNAAGGFFDIPAAPGIVGWVSLHVDACQPRPVLTTDLKISPNPANVGDTVTASVSIKNAGCGDFVAEIIGVEDFPSVQNLTIHQGNTYTYQQSHIFDTAGDYGGGIAYKVPGGGWYSIHSSAGEVD